MPGSEELCFRDGKGHERRTPRTGWCLFGAGMRYYGTSFGLVGRRSADQDEYVCAKGIYRISLVVQNYLYRRPCICLHHTRNVQKLG